MNIVKIIKTLIRIARTYDKDKTLRNQELDTKILKINNKLEEAVKVIKDRTEVNLNHEYYGGSYVILLGHYHNSDYVECIPVDSKRFDYLVNELKVDTQYAHLNKIDMAPQFKQVIKREKLNGSF